MATFAFKAVDLSGIPQSGEIIGADKQAATTELKSKGLKVMALEEKKTGLQMELRLRPKRVKAGDLTVMSRQLATMISSGMTLLRAFYVLEEQVENQHAPRDDQHGPRGHRGRPLVLGRARAPPEGLQPAVRRDDPLRRGRRRARGVARAHLRPAREGRLAAPPGQVGDGLPDRRLQLRADRPDRHDRVHRPGVRRACSRTSAASCRRSRSSRSGSRTSSPASGTS